MAFAEFLFELFFHESVPLKISLDEAIKYPADDELLEVTPLSYRIRKRILSIDDRGKQLKRDQEAMEE